jgi:murein DD-endopeptidase MepM/ murein hydrolase activator NlpD
MGIGVALGAVSVAQSDRVEGDQSIGMMGTEGLYFELSEGVVVNLVDPALYIEF